MHHKQSYTLTFIIILLFIFTYYINSINIVEDVKDVIRIQVFNGLSIIFALLVIYYSIHYGVTRGLFASFITWCVFVTATPIPEAALLISVPLKNVFNINLDITQWVASFFAMGSIIYSYLYYNSLLKKTEGGNFVSKVIDLRVYSIFITSIISSVCIAYLINEMVDFVIYQKELHPYYIKVYTAIGIISFIGYFISFYQTRVKKLY